MTVLGWNPGPGPGSLWAPGWPRPFLNSVTSLTGNSGIARSLLQVRASRPAVVVRPRVLETRTGLTLLKTGIPLSPCSSLLPLAPRLAASPWFLSSSCWLAYDLSTSSLVELCVRGPFLVRPPPGPSPLFPRRPHSQPDPLGLLVFDAAPVLAGTFCLSPHTSQSNPPSLLVLFSYSTPVVLKVWFRDGQRQRHLGACQRLDLPNLTSGAGAVSTPCFTPENLGVHPPR